MSYEKEPVLKSVAKAQRGFIHKVRNHICWIILTLRKYFLKHGCKLQIVNNNVIDFLAQEVWLFDPGDPKV